MSTKSLLSAGRFLILPVLFTGLVAISIQGHAWEERLPHWTTFLTLAAVIAMERLYANSQAVSQKALLVRDLTSTFVNVFITGVVTTFLVLPVLSFALQHLFGRKSLFASPLGPVWLQVIAILLLVSFFRYWMHRLQHRNEFLWSLHSYHHRVTDLRALNDLTSNPVDFALRNLLVYVLLGVVGFDARAFLFAVPVLSVWGIFSHCGGDVRGGWLNYMVATPEVHRWHHTAQVPEGYGYSVNYGVEFSFWDLAFGTYYLPMKDGQPMRPHIGHPGGLPDEGNYLKVLLAPFGLYGIVSRLRRLLRIPEGPQAAE
ncbi:MAG TPA: sterol desaturase family protein [Rhizomicrobium sp.]|nr:sterol desaturase family protein [Rhizomicrobium sp.]